MMKLRWICIKGFRSIRKITLDMDDFMCLIGQNNHGKSNKISFTPLICVSLFGEERSDT